MSTVTCQCGALYERTEKKVIFRDKDSFNCRFCGKELESWSGSRILLFRDIPLFRLLKRPNTDTD